jgi:hypothetical protein
MPVETWSHTYTVAADPNTVYDYLAEPTHYLKLSPLIVSVSDIQYRRDADGNEQCSYCSTERFNFAGFIRYDNPLR